ILLWDAETGKKLSHLEPAPPDTKFESVAFLGSAGVVCCLTDKGTFYRLEDGAATGQITRLTGSGLPHPTDPRHPAGRPAGKPYPRVSGRKVLLQDVTKAVPLAVWVGHERPVTGVAFSPDGKRFASLEEQDVKVWDAAAPDDAWSPEQTAEGLNDVALSRDGRWLAVSRYTPGPLIDVDFGNGDTRKQRWRVDLLEAQTGRHVRLLNETAQS